MRMKEIFRSCADEHYHILLLWGPQGYSTYRGSRWILFGYLQGMGALADILSVLRRERARLFAKYGLKSMAVFGSATRDDFRPGSDVDIMVEFERPIGIEFMDLADELEGMLKRKVDLATKGAVKPWYMETILPDLKYV
jgi:predicted nucleotidyltransferase